MGRQMVPSEVAPCQRSGLGWSPSAEAARGAGVAVSPAAAKGLLGSGPPPQPGEATGPRLGERCGAGNPWRGDQPTHSH